MLRWLTVTEVVTLYSRPAGTRLPAREPAPLAEGRDGRRPALYLADDVADTFDQLG